MKRDGTIRRSTTPAPGARRAAVPSTTRRSTTVARARAKRKRRLGRKLTQLRANTPRQARTLMAQARFLVAFAEFGNVLRAARAASVHRCTVYAWLEQPTFKRLYDEALLDAADALEDEARRRAVEGVLEPLVSAGSYVCDVRKYSDTLLVLLLKGKKPDVYRERVEHTGKDGAALFAKTVREEPTEELVARGEALLEQVKAQLA